ncbi:MULTISPECIES: hypothetical protein [Streptomyces]|uniref:Uncharacterized protein n=1 Tax=Streptomyces edwardsiae TaxID=3075527 RepID=A0ABU2QN89_9ACTN|nr:MULTISPECIES: hypothetical protein [unclassified Streptomyces]MDT0405924.1 hypothetical protein [Streptomyces sp. DSM 41635]
MDGESEAEHEEESESRAAAPSQRRLWTLVGAICGTGVGVGLIWFGPEVTAEDLEQIAKVAVIGYLSAGLAALSFLGAAKMRWRDRGRQVPLPSPVLTPTVHQRELRTAAQEIEQDDIDDTVDDVARFLSEPTTAAAPSTQAAATTVKGLTEIFLALGPPPPGTAKEHGSDAPGPSGGVGAGPRGKNA